MVHFDESPKHLAKLLGLTHFASGSDRRLARKWVSNIIASFNPKYLLHNDVVSISHNLSEAILLELLKTESYKLERFDEDMENMMKPALNLLLSRSKGLQVIDLTGFASFSPAAGKYKALEMAISAVCVRAPTLLSLAVLEEVRCKGRVLRSKLTQSLVNAFCAMQNLQMLRFELCSFDLASLMLICERLPNLQFVSVNIASVFVLPCVERLETSFKRLKAFFFRSEASEERLVALRQLCRQHLPNLQVVQDFASDFCSQGCFQYAPHVAGRHNLRHLTLHLRYERLQEELHLLFPHVTHLKITWADHFPIDDLQEVWPLLKFSEIESLHLSLVPEPVAVQFLSVYGSNLHSLSLTVPLSFNRIFSLCPKLERASLSTEDPDVPIDRVKLLKEIRIKSLGGANILCSPNLEKVTFEGQKGRAGELTPLTAFVACSRKWLRKLETIVVDMCCFCINDVEQPYFFAVAAFVKNAGNGLPKLSAVQFKLNKTCDYLVLAQSVLESKFTNAEVAGVESFFRGTDDFEALEWFVDDSLMEVLGRFKFK